MPETDTFRVSYEDFSGSLDFLVESVQRKKIDISSVPVLAIVEQFLDWIRTEMNARLELASDWLDLAATLALLKSRLLLPSSREEKAQADAAVEDLFSRLQRMQAVKGIVEDLLRRRQLGIHWHEPGDRDPSKARGKRLEATLHTLLVAYVREAKGSLLPPPPPVKKPFVVQTVEEAIEIVRAFIVRSSEWKPLVSFVPPEPPVDIIHARSRIATAYVASLELAKRGLVEVMQVGDSVSLRARDASEIGA